MLSAFVRRTPMLGELLGEERGKVSVYRVISVEGGAPKVEVSFQASGKLLGMDATDIGTYHSVPKAGGFLQGEGQGVVMTRDGDMASWVGSGVGKLGPGGSASWRGSLFFTTTSPKLGRLNGIAVVFEYEVDQHGATSSRFWEWK
jgi:hypothetical protein